MPRCAAQYYSGAEAVAVQCKHVRCVLCELDDSSLLLLALSGYHMHQHLRLVGLLCEYDCIATTLPVAAVYGRLLESLDECSPVHACSPRSLCIARLFIQLYTT